MRIASERPQPPVHSVSLIRVLLSLLHSRCYDAQHLKSGLFTAPLLRHLHGHCVVCYTVQCWLVFVMIIPVGRRGERRLTLMFCHRLSPVLLCQNWIWNRPRSHLCVRRLTSSDVTLVQLFQADLCGFSYLADTVLVIFRWSNWSRDCMLMQRINSWLIN